jgi:hypothetical protein
MADATMKFCGFRLPLPMADKVEDILRAESLQMTEYVRDLVRKDLRKRGVLVPADESEQPETTGVEA